MFTSSKWDILKIISGEKKSPLELARLANTSMANVSQQLRLLEFAGIVKSERISNRDKGKPRVLYSLAKDTSYLITVAKGFVQKKFVALDDHHESILRIWYLPNEQMHYFVEKAFWKAESYLQKIDAMYLEDTEAKDPTIIVCSKDASLGKALTDFSVKHPDTNITKTVKFKIIDEAQRMKNKNLYAIYSRSKKYLGEVIK